MIKNKEVVDALCLLLHCSLKDKKYETQKEQFNLVYDYIEKLEKHIEFYEKHGSYKEKINEMQRQIDIKNAYLDIIYDIGIDYDGCNTIKSLKELIDEFMKWAKFAIENNDREPMFIGARDKEFNILHEELSLKMDIDLNEACLNCMKGE